MPRFCAERRCHPEEREHNQLRDPPPHRSRRRHLRSASTRDIRRDWRMHAVPAAASRLITVDLCQRPPRRVSMPRALSSSAIAPRAACPEARTSASTGARSGRMPVGVAFRSLPGAAPALAGPAQCRCPVRVAEPNPARLGYRQRLLGPPRDRFPLLLRHQRNCSTSWPMPYQSAGAHALAFLVCGPPVAKGWAKPESAKHGKGQFYAHCQPAAVRRPGAKAV